MKTIGFFLKNSNLAHVDWSKPQVGNPGIGGREYMNSLISYAISYFCDDDFKINLYSQVDVKIPEIQSLRISGTIEEAIEKASNDNIDYFVLDVSIKHSNVFGFIEAAEKHKLKILVRLGLLPNFKILDMLAESEWVVAVVCNEREVYEIIKDHKVSSKSLIMQNPIALESYTSKPVPLLDRHPTVVYMGSLVPQKGFQRLARVWKDVLKNTPEAKLIVLGSGTLYDRRGKLGAWGVASESFEKIFKPFLSDVDGNLDKSVSFLGNLGQEKNVHLSQATIGVANPTGATETFCLAAIEIQANFTPCVAGKNGGLFDTINDGITGYVVNSDDEFKNKIIFLLNNRDKAYRMGLAGREYVEGRYDFKKVAHRWALLFQSLDNGNVLPKDEYYKYGRSIFSKVSTYNFMIKRLFWFESYWPSTMEIYYYFSKFVMGSLRSLKKIVARMR